MWVQLTSIQNIEVNGVPHTYNPGDWVEVGRQQAQYWLASGAACVPSVKPSELILESSVGVLVRQGQLDSARVALFMYDDKMQIRESDGLTLPWQRTALFDTMASVNPAYIAVGLNLLDRWEIAAPLYDYKTLACHIGDEAERAKTKNIIRDLRVPIYDIRLIFARKCDNTERLIELWNKDGGDPHLSFLRSLYRVKPFVLALPCNWTGHSING